MARRRRKVFRLPGETLEEKWRRADRVTRVWMLGPISAARKTRDGAHRAAGKSFKNLPSDVKARLRKFEAVF